jgi:hypothetical protein
MAQGCPGGLRTRNIDIRHYKGGRLSASRTGRLYPRRNSWYSFLEAESTPGHMVLSVAPRKIPATDATGIRSRDHSTSSTHHCATPGTSGHQGNTEIDLEETYSDTVDRIHVSQDQWQWTAFMWVTMNDGLWWTRKLSRRIFFTPWANKSDGLVHRVICARLANGLSTENCVLLGYYTSSSGNSFLTLRDDLSVRPSRAKNNKKRLDQKVVPKRQ